MPRKEAPLAFLHSPDRQVTEDHVVHIATGDRPDVDPARHQGLLTFGVMAATIAVLTFAYGLGATLLTHFLAERMRANPVVGRVLEKVAGVFLIGFGVKLALSK